MGVIILVSMAFAICTRHVFTICTKFVRDFTQVQNNITKYNSYAFHQSRKYVDFFKDTNHMLADNSGISVLDDPSSENNTEKTSLDVLDVLFFILPSSMLPSFAAATFTLKHIFLIIELIQLQQFCFFFLLLCNNLTILYPPAYPQQQPQHIHARKLDNNDDTMYNIFLVQQPRFDDEDDEEDDDEDDDE